MFVVLHDFREPWIKSQRTIQIFEWDLVTRYRRKQYIGNLSADTKTTKRVLDGEYLIVVLMSKYETIQIKWLHCLIHFNLTTHGRYRFYWDKFFFFTILLCTWPCFRVIWIVLAKVSCSPYKRSEEYIKLFLSKKRTETFTIRFIAITRIFPLL